MLVSLPLSLTSLSNYIALLTCKYLTLHTFCLAGSDAVVGNADLDNVLVGWQFLVPSRVTALVSTFFSVSFFFLFVLLSNSSVLCFSVEFPI